MEGLGRFKVCAIPLANLRKAPWNYKNDNEECKEKLKEAIRRNGQLVNMIVRPIGGALFEVVNGNHRLDALTELGEEEALCVNLGEVSEEQAIRIGIETNEIQFETNDVRLATALSKLADKFPLEDMLKTLPYDSATLDQYLKLSTFDWTPIAGSEEHGGTVEREGKKLKMFSLEVDFDTMDLWSEWLEVIKDEGEAVTEPIALKAALLRALGR